MQCMHAYIDVEGHRNQEEVYKADNSDGMNDVRVRVRVLFLKERRTRMKTNNQFDRNNCCAVLYLRPVSSSSCACMCKSFCYC